MTLVAAPLLFLLGGCSGDGESDGTDDAGDAGMCALVTDDLMPPAGATLKFMEPCIVGQDAQCETNFCFSFNERGPHCTAVCKDPCECPSPSGGCSKMGVCKAP